MLLAPLLRVLPETDSQVRNDSMACANLTFHFCGWSGNINSEWHKELPNMCYYAKLFVCGSSKYALGSAQKI